MSRLRDLLAQASIRVESPRGVLTLDADGTGQLAVTVPDGRLNGWSESELEREVADTIDSALRAARRAYLRARREAFAPDPRPGEDAAVAGTGAVSGGREDESENDAADDLEGDRAGDLPPAVLRAPRRSTSGESTDIFRDAVERLEVAGVSERGYVTIIRGDDHLLQVRIQQRCLQHLRAAEIAAEISSACSRALASFHEGHAAAHRAVFGAPPGFGG